MATRPSTAAYRFATSAGVRAALTAARKLSGWVGGEAVGQGEQNDVLGMLSDWVTWLSSLPATAGFQASAIRLYAGDGPWLPDDADSLVTRPANETIRVTANAATDAVCRRAWGPTAIGGVVDSVTVEVINDLGNDYDLTLLVRGKEANGTTNKLIGFALTAQSAAGAMVLPLTAGTNDGIYGPVTFQFVLKAPPAGGYVTIQTIDIVFEDTP